jgi:hypothetical protein
VRIDAAGEERFEARVDARAAQPLFHERVEAEAGQMAFIEHDRMPERDRLAVVRLFREQVEQPARPRAVFPVPSDKGRAVNCHSCIFIQNRRPLVFNHVTLGR